MRRFIQRILFRWQHKTFINIKEETNGYLSPSVYKAIYEYALKAQEGNMVDIGPAQGGSTICLGLGIRDSGKANSKIYSIEKGEASSALQSWDDPLHNGAVLLKNIQRYELDSYVNLLLGDVKDMYQKVNASKPLSLLFIDADGALDRDFQLFFNRLSDGASIIIDDYQDIINRLATEKYLKWSTPEEIDVYVRSKGAQEFRDLCPLGKEQTTYRFINYFLSAGLIQKKILINATFFGSKIPGSVFDPVLHGNALKRIRAEIEQDYYQLRRTLTN